MALLICFLIDHTLYRKKCMIFLEVLLKSVGVARVLQSIEEKMHSLLGCIHPVSAKTFEPNNSVIFQRIFVKFKMQIF
jgi:hypothetical protein